jgi:hypothetical protein
MNQVTLPIYYTEHFKTKPSKTFLMSLNWYRNAFYHQQAKVKRDYHELISNFNLKLDIDSPYKLHLTLYYKNKNSDGANIAPLIEKFFLDAIQDLKIVKNDTVMYHLGTTWEVGGEDKENPRCEVVLLPQTQNQ